MELYVCMYVQNTNEHIANGVLKTRAYLSVHLRLHGATEYVENYKNLKLGYFRTVVSVEQTIKLVR